MKLIKNKKLQFAILGGALLALLIYLTYLQTDDFNVFISDKEPPILQNSCQTLQKQMRREHFTPPVDLYVEHFSEDQLLSVPNQNHTNILWLGSRNNLAVPYLKNFDYVLTSSNDLKSYLHKHQTKSDYHPLFVAQTDAPPSKCVLHPDSPECYFLIVGNQPQIINYIRQQNIRYKYELTLTKTTIEQNLQNIDKISGIITNQTRYAEQSLDIEPFYLEAINHQIPILCPNLYQNPDKKILENHLMFQLLFTDSLSYYTYKSDIKDYFSCISCRLAKSKKAKYILDNLYSVTALKNHIHALLNNQPYEPHIKNTITIVSPTHPGLYNNGDYWIAKDLEHAFADTFDQTLTVFPMSIISYIGDVYLYIRGGIPLETNKIRPNTVSLYYLLFPSFTDEINLDKIDNFIESIKPELKNVDAVAVASAKLTKILQEKGINAYYIPQFTNTDKFYPDYDQTKQSDVLFVGNYLNYRTAVPIALSAGLPLTVYGNGWPQNVAKASYIDNRILRKYYSSAKIVLNDTRSGMKKYGFIINRIFDVTACRTLVISDYMKEIEEVYGDTVPMWKTEAELIELIKYYLSPEHEAERQDKANRAYEITLKNFTAKSTTEKFNKIISSIKQQKGLK